jgi:hypothetical protein
LREELNRLQARVFAVAPEGAVYEDWRSRHQPFNWVTEFYEIVQERGGFNAIIGNPPYVEYKDVKDYHVVQSDVLPCRDLYAFTFERSLLLAQVGGRVGLIVPLSAFSVQQFEPLQSLIYTKSDAVFISNWSGDAHPSKLFEGVDKRLQIVLIHRRNGPQPAKVHTSKYQKWYSDERPALFECSPTYLGLSNFALYQFFSGPLPKISLPIEDELISKLLSCKSNIGMHSTVHGKNVIFYTRKSSFFLQFLDFVPELWDSQGNLREPSELKELRFEHEAMRDFCLAALSSSLFYWYNIVNSDCRNLNKREIISFPVPREISIDDARTFSDFV